MNLKTFQKSLSFIIVLYSFVHFFSILYIHKVFTCNVFKMWKYVSAKIETIYVVTFAFRSFRSKMSHMHNKSSNKKKNETPKYNKYFDFINIISFCKL